MLFFDFGKRSESRPPWFGGEGFQSLGVWGFLLLVSFLGFRVCGLGHWLLPRVRGKAGHVQG